MVMGCLSLSLLLMVAWPSCLAVDMTIEEKAHGTEVVLATVALVQESCIFDDDALMLRRIAHVETTDGEDPHTFERNGNDYYGGIWQIEEVTFDEIKNHQVTIDKYLQILDHFGIDWYQTKYEDLWKPLYCALAARLWMDIKLLEYPDTSIPRDVNDQGDFWANYYKVLTSEDAGSGPTPQYYVDKVDELESGCDVARADFLFVLDGSGSIGADNFVLMQDFVKDIVGSSNIGPDEVRVGVIRYSTDSTVQFAIGAYDTIADNLNAIDAISYEGGGTASHLALQGTVTEFLANGRGDSGIPQICIFMTDGQSNDVYATAQAADYLHNHPDLAITVFAIGVTSGAVLSELETIGSEPSCIHVYLLESFEDMESFKTQLERQACNAPAEIEEGEDSEGSVESGSYVFFKLKVKMNHKGVTIKLKMRSGSSHVYVSYKVRNPSAALYQYHMHVDSSNQDGKDLGIPFPNDVVGTNETDVFMSLLGDGFGQENLYTVGYEDGYSGVAGLKPTLIGLVLAFLLHVLLRQ